MNNFQSQIVILLGKQYVIINTEADHFFRSVKLVGSKEHKISQEEWGNKLSKKFPNISFCLITGDNKFNPEADVVIMTTEILLNTLDKIKALEYIEMISKKVKEVGGIFTLLWHPHLIIDEISWNTFQETLMMLKKDEPWFASVREIGEWWKNKLNIDHVSFIEGEQN